MLRLPPRELERIRSHAREAFPEEACGFLLGRASPEGREKEVVEARPASNEKLEERQRRYLIQPQQLLAAEEEAMRRGLDVLGFYHSHPTGVARPSEFDREHAWPWYSYVVAGVTAAGVGEVTSWQLRDDRTAFTAEDIVQIAGP